jgi:transposase-like protein
MRQNTTLPIRPCPICGIAMQGRKSKEGVRSFDRFECLSCGATIELPEPEKPPSRD